MGVCLLAAFPSFTCHLQRARQVARLYMPTPTPTPMPSSGYRKRNATRQWLHTALTMVIELYSHDRLHAIHFSSVDLSPPLWHITSSYVASLPRSVRLGLRSPPPNSGPETSPSTTLTCRACPWNARCQLVNSWSLRSSIHTMDHLKPLSTMQCIISSFRCRMAWARTTR